MSNPLLDNIERTVFTFNMHNLGEFCFSQVFGDESFTKATDGLTV